MISLHTNPLSNIEKYDSVLGSFRPSLHNLGVFHIEIAPLPLTVGYCIKWRIWEGSRVPWNPLSSPEGAWNPLGQRVLTSWNHLDLKPSKLGTLWAPGEKGKMHDWSKSVPTIFIFFQGVLCFCYIRAMIYFNLSEWFQNSQWVPKFSAHKKESHYMYI